MGKDLDLSVGVTSEAEFIRLARKRIGNDGRLSRLGAAETKKGN